MKSKKSATHHRNYEVGRGRPPVQYRFKKGQPSPNPKGRPRGSKKVDLAALLKELVTIKKAGRTLKLPFLEALVEMVKDRAIRGDVKFVQLLLGTAKHLKMLDVPEVEEDYTFTLNIPLPPRVKRKMEEDKKRRGDDGSEDDED
jgi:hypothetical protein